MNDPSKRVIIKVGLREWRADIVCLQKTKMEVMTNVIVRRLWSRSWVKYEYIPARGNAGGLILLWDERKVECREVKSGEFCLAVKFRSYGIRVEWGFEGGGVYGPAGEGSKMLFWAEMASFMEEWIFRGYWVGILILPIFRRRGMGER